ncbi:MAG TPA: MYXO-CTERM sorting domain-containing protein, partial [Anaerolineae bacterium]|nr:MYXO-CTERM sorting domain-containing protein [Anaerolineae bacterium]
TTLPSGWFMLETGTAQNITYTASTGSANTGDTYSFGAAGNSERAFGGVQSGNLSPTIGAGFNNGTNDTIGQIAISYVCEQWRLGFAARTDRMDFQYSTDATSLSTGTWADYNALDCIAANSTGTVGAFDGNAAANRIIVTAVLSNTGVFSVPIGTNFWIRWTDFNATNSDDGLGVDDFSMNLFSPTAVTLSDLSASSTTSPAPIVFGVLGLTAAALLLRRRLARSTPN